MLLDPQEERTSIEPDHDETAASTFAGFDLTDSNIREELTKRIFED